MGSATMQAANRRNLKAVSEAVGNIARTRTGRLAGGCSET
jgi:hypothetical protein